MAENWIPLVEAMAIGESIVIRSQNVAGVRGHDVTLLPGDTFSFTYTFGPESDGPTYRYTVDPGSDEPTAADLVGKITDFGAAWHVVDSDGTHEHFDRGHRHEGGMHPHMHDD